MGNPSTVHSPQSAAKAEEKRKRKKENKYR
jgi:hypothetical protein